MVQQVAGACGQGEGLPCFAGGIAATRRESAAEIGIEMDRPGHYPGIPRQAAIDAGSRQQAELRCVDSRTGSGSIRGTIVEYPVAIVVRPRGHVVWLAARAVEGSGEREPQGQTQLANGEETIRRFPRRLRHLSVIAVAVLGKERRAIRVGLQAEVEIADKELQALERVLIDTSEEDRAMHVAGLLELKNIPVRGKGARGQQRIDGRSVNQRRIDIT